MLPSPARALVSEPWLLGRPHRHLLYSGVCISGGGRVWGCKAGPRFPPPVSPPTCFEGSALSLVLLDSILSGSKLKTSSNPKWEKSLQVVHLFKWIFIIKF